MGRYSDKTYCEMLDYVENISAQINDMHNICPIIFLMFNQDNAIGGSAILTYRISDMYIELDIPHNYKLSKSHNKNLTCVLVHEYCHYLDALSMSGKERADNMVQYTNNQKYRRTEEQRNWTATKQLAKKMGLWNRSFYAAARECYYTAGLQF